MTRAVVIKTYGDPEIAGAIVEGMAQGARLNERELEVVRAENVRLNALNGVRSYGDSVRWESVSGALAVKYSIKTHGRLYGAILGAWACLWLGIVEWYEYLSTWNRG